MAQPANSLDSYNLVGIREDLQDVIYNIDPEETPFYTACAKMRASNTLHEWQTDTLRASADNAHIEGDDTVAEARAVTSRLGNYTQIFKKEFIVSDTQEKVAKAGRRTEGARQTVSICGLAA